MDVTPQNLPRLSAEALLADYCASPQTFWPQGSDRQARKLQRRLRATAATLDLEPREVALALVAAARERSIERRKTVYLGNIGSSGSHWLEAMLVAGAGMLGAGEVYLPRRLVSQLEVVATSERAIFTDALHLLHAGGITDDAAASAINSLHSARPDDFLASDAGALRVLLLRDPVEVCLSRVYRKDEYRADVASSADDMTYLNDNIRKISSFLTVAQEQVFDLVVRYEDLVTNPLPALTAICGLTETPVDESCLRQVVRDQAADQLTQQTASRTNLYTGPRRNVPPAIEEIARSKLGELGHYFGYRS